MEENKLWNVLEEKQPQSVLITRGSKEVQGSLEYLKKDVGSTEKYGVYK
jgi:hypothetical protein